MPLLSIERFTWSSPCSPIWSHFVLISKVVVKNPPASVGDVRDAGLIPELGRSPGGEHNNPLQYSCLEESVDRGAWRATVHRVTKSVGHDWSDSAHSRPFCCPNTVSLFLYFWLLYDRLPKLLSLKSHQGWLLICLSSKKTPPLPTAASHLVRRHFSPSSVHCHC